MSVGGLEIRWQGVGGWASEWSESVAATVACRGRWRSTPKLDGEVVAFEHFPECLAETNLWAPSQSWVRHPDGA